MGHDRRSHGTETQGNISKSKIKVNVCVVCCVCQLVAVAVRCRCGVVAAAWPGEACSVAATVGLGDGAQ